MKVETQEVKSKGAVVATVDIEQFDSIAEAVEFLGSQEDGTCDNAAGETKFLALANRQYKQDLCNAARAEARPDTASKSKRREYAKSYINHLNAQGDTELLDKLKEVAITGSFSELENFLESVFEEFQQDIHDTVINAGE
jgi:hypothetical protein